jgi:uncharacterized membrane protein
MTVLIRLLTGLVLSALIGLLAYRRGSLARSGVLGAVIVGTAIFGFGGWAWGLLLILFFVTSSLLSHFQERRKERLAEKFAKGHRRDIWQALRQRRRGRADRHCGLCRPALQTIPCSRRRLFGR